MLFKGIWRPRDVIQARQYVVDKTSYVLSESFKPNYSKEDQNYRDLAAAIVAQTILDYLSDRSFVSLHDRNGKERLYLRPGQDWRWSSIFESIEGYLDMVGINLSGEELRKILDEGRHSDWYVRRLRGGVIDLF